MKIEINQKYIDWVRDQKEIERQNLRCSNVADEELTKYINTVLENHMKSWDELYQI